MSRPVLVAWMRAACVALALVLSGCGGDGSVGSGGTGAPVSGLAVGTVTGFGSVIVDGVPYDDVDAAAVVEDAPGIDTRTEARLGHRVEIGLDEGGAVRTLRLDGAVRGRIARVTPASLQFVVLEQTVQVVQDPALGPVTSFGGGFTGFASLAPGDLVDVHGVVVPQGASAVIQATRIDPIGLPAFVRVSGLVSSLTPGTFRLGALTIDHRGGAVVPAGVPLQAGQAVTVLAPPSAFVDDTLAAAQVRIKAVPPEGGSVQVSGPIASLDVGARTFFVDRQRVDYGATDFAPPAGSPPPYVRVRGPLAADGTLRATEVVVRDARGGGAQAELRGNIHDVDPAGRTFIVRNETVAYGQATPTGCPDPLADGLFVELTGRLSPTGVIADVLRCLRIEPPEGVHERRGTASQVSLAARTFRLTLDSGQDVTVAWNAATLFRDLPPEALDGQRLHVEGVQAGQRLVARTVRLAPR